MSSKKEKDKVIFKQIKFEDDKTFEAIFDKYYKQLLQYAFLFVRDLNTAEEIVSDVFTTIWKKRKQLNIKSNLSGFLYRSTKNKAISFLRKNKIEFYDIEETTEITSPSPEKNIIREENEQKVKNILNLIPPRSREVFVLQKFDGLKYEEIANLLGISKKTVENHMVKALKILRDYYKN